MNWTLLKNSLLVSVLTTLLSVGFGFLAALWLTGLSARWRNGLLAAAVTALALPPFLVTNCWLHLLGDTGVWRGWLPFRIFSLGGTVWILALLTWPITMLTAWTAWQRLEVSQLESDTAVSGWSLMRGLLLPSARRALGVAAVLTFVLALNNFAVPAILQVKVFPAELWVSFNTNFWLTKSGHFDYAAAFSVTWPLVLMPLVLLFLFRRTEIPWPQIEGTVPAKIFRRQLGAGWFWFCGIITTLLCLLSVGLPLFQLASVERTWTELLPALAAGQVAVWNSFSFAAVAATSCVALGLIGWQWPIGVALWLPFLVPGVLLGIGLITFFNRPWFAVFYQSAAIVVIAFVIRYLAIGWNGVAHALRATDRDLTDTARLSGASRWQLLRHVHWPQIAPQLAAAWYVIYLLCLWDVESMILVVPPGGETLALRIFNLLHYGHNAQVNALCLTLLALAVAPLIVWWAGQFIANGRLPMANRSRTTSLVLLVVVGCAFSGCTPPPSANEALIKSQFFSRVEIIGSRGVGVGQFNKPRSVAVDKQDNLYVVDMTGRVQKFSSDGRFLLLWQMPQTDLGKPKGMICDRDGNIIVLEPHYQRVNHFSPEGKLVAQWGSHGTNAGQFTLPRAVAVNSRGEIFVSEYTGAEQVQKFALVKNEIENARPHPGPLPQERENRSPSRAELLCNFGHAGTRDGEFNRAEGLGIGPDDRVYVADSCNHRIQIFSPDGGWLRSYGKAGSGKGELSYPYDIRVDAAGRQYVCEFGNSRIQIFDEHDQLLEILGRPGAAPGEFANPWSIALDSRGNLYVADSQNHRVQKFIRNSALSNRLLTSAATKSR